MTSFAPEILVHLGSLPITNTLLNTLLVDAVLLGAAYAITRKISVIPTKLQNVAESVIVPMYELVESIADKKRAIIIFPYFMTFFLFILVANWSGLLPGFGSIGFWEQTEHGRELLPIFRNATTDLNTTFALAIVSIVATHMLGIKMTGVKDYSTRFLPLSPMIFIGLLEIISEITKVVSLSFRLFGNIFAGEILLGTVSKIFPLSAFFVPIPFMMLEIIVGLVQALVFSMLTMAFMTILTTPHHEAAKEVSH